MMLIMSNAKKKVIILVMAILCAGYLSAQEVPVFQYSEPSGRFNLTLSKENAPAGGNCYVTLSYRGEDFQLYRSITLRIDGKEYWLIFANITQDWTGFSTETYKTKRLPSELLTALKNAAAIEFTIDSVRWNRADTFSLTNEGLASIKRLLR